MCNKNTLVFSMLVHQSETKIVLKEPEHIATPSTSNTDQKMNNFLEYMHTTGWNTWNKLNTIL